MGGRGYYTNQGKTLSFPPTPRQTTERVGFSASKTLKEEKEGKEIREQSQGFAKNKKVMGCAF